LKLVSTLLFIFLSTNVYSQNWLRVDSVFSLSGVGVKNFSAPAFGDLNNDGDLDLLLGNSSDITDFYWNNSHQFPSTFTKDTSILFNIYSGGQINTNSDYPVFVDLDNDTDLDLVIGGYNGLLYYKNIGTKLSPQFTEDYSVFADVNLKIGQDAKPAFVDIDNDGDLDLYCGIGESFISGPTAGITMSFKNTGTALQPQFTLNSSFVAGIPDLGLNSYPAFADLDNDGDFDLLFGRDQGSLVYYKNTGTKQNPIWTNNSELFSGIESATYWKNPVLTDLDYDGDFDLVYGTSSGVLFVYKNIGSVSSPTFQYYPDYFKITKLNGNGASVSLADFDGDGDNDLLSGIWTGKFIYFRNDGNSTKPVFNQVDVSFSNFTQITSYSTPVFVDIDNDGDFDIVSGALNGQVYLYINTNGVFTQNTSTFSSIDVGWSSIPSFADLDGDGDLDLLVGSETGISTKYFSNDGYNNFQENVSTFSTVAFPNYSRPTLADIDNDNDYDLIIGDGWGEVFYYLNEGTMYFPKWAQFDVLFDGIEVKQNAHPGFADLDGDGRKDMIIGEYDGNFNYFKNLFSPITVIEDQNTTSSVNDFILFQNYPNPFNPVTTISYDLKIAGRVTLKVYDILGNLVKTLVDEDKVFGIHRVDFLADSLASGVYFYTLRVNGVAYSKSMIFMK